ALPPLPPHRPTSPPPALRLSPTRGEGEPAGIRAQYLPLSHTGEREAGDEGWEALAQYSAVELFIARAQAVQSHFALTQANAPAVAAICVKLDGLPLAIELAAARIKLFSPQALRARLAGSHDDAPLYLLAGGPHDLPPRQRTLRNAIAWSYDLLDAREQALF